MLKAIDYPNGTPVYSFVDKAGENFHIDSRKLRLWCLDNLTKLEVVQTPINPEMAKSYLLEGVVDHFHVLRVMDMPKWDPLIYGLFGPAPTGDTVSIGDVMHIDGHHRYVAAAVMGMKWAKSWLLERKIWEEFRIEGLPDLTEEQLRAIPPRGDHR